MTVEKVKSLVKFARKIGYAVNEGNTQKGVTAVAIPLFDSQNIPTGAIAVASVSKQIDPIRRAQVAEICLPWREPWFSTMPRCFPDWC